MDCCFMTHQLKSCQVGRAPTELSLKGPQAFRWRLVADKLLPVTFGLRLGEATRAAVYRRADARGLLPLPDHFHHGSDKEHSHAFWLPEDTDEDGFVDQVLLFATSGLPERLIPVLAEGGEISLFGLGRWRLAPDWMGRRAPGALFGPARYWRSVTPYVTPLWRGRKGGGDERRGLGPEDQLRDEIVQRRLPAALVRVTLTPNVVRGRFRVPAQNFSLDARGRKPPGDAVAVGAEILFEEPVWGPLAFGFGAHFGLGLFEWADTNWGGDAGVPRLPSLYPSMP
jgi:CRISPR-associated protein Csb2